MTKQVSSTAEMIDYLIAFFIPPVSHICILTPQVYLIYPALIHRLARSLFQTWLRSRLPDQHPTHNSRLASGSVACVVDYWVSTWPFPQHGVLVEAQNTSFGIIGSTNALRTENIRNPISLTARKVNVKELEMSAGAVPVGAGGRVCSSREIGGRPAIRGE